MSLLRIDDPGPWRDPLVVVAFDAWVDAGSASIAAAELLGAAGRIVGRIDGDACYDYRSRRPTLEIVDGRPRTLTWPEVILRLVPARDRDLLVLSGAEPDYRWRELADEIVRFARERGIREWLSLGAIPAAVPHTRPVPILGTESRPGLLRGPVRPGPDGTLRVPSACLSVLDHAIAAAGHDAVGYFAQVPHYVSGPYPAASLALLDAVAGHLGEPVPRGDLAEQAEALRRRLDAATTVDETTRTYVDQLEATTDEERLASGGDLIAEIERFLREQGDPGGPEAD